MLPRRRHPRRCRNDRQPTRRSGGILNLTTPSEAIILLLLTMMCVWSDSTSSSSPSSSVFVRAATDTPRIVGGSSATIGEYPYFGKC